MIKFYIPVLTIMLFVDIQSISSYNNETESDDYDNNDTLYPITSMSTENIETTRFDFLVPSSSLKEENDLINDADEATDFPKVSQVTTSNVNNVIRAPTIDYKLLKPPTTTATTPTVTIVKPTVDTSKIVCPIKLLEIPILQTLIPSSYLALRGVLYNLARLNSTQYFYGKAYELLEKEANIASIAAYFAKRSAKGKEKLLTAYRNSQNTSSTPMYSYLLKKQYFDLGIIGGKWTSPAWDCVLNKWIFGWILSVQGISGSIGVFHTLDRVDLNQCDVDLALLFGGKHRCDPATTLCEHKRGFGLRRGGYDCKCKEGFAPPDAQSNASSWLYPGDKLEAANFTARCKQTCGQGMACKLETDHFLRHIILGVQILCMTLTFLLMCVVFNNRKWKTISAGMWTILETVLLGILIMYSSVLVHLWEPTTLQCLLASWLRELGFIVCYGAILLKLYRILMEFRTRKAHRLVLRDKDLLKYLCGMVLIIVAYLSAWTASNMNFIEEGFSLLTIGKSQDGSFFNACKPLWWDYVTEAGEVVLLLFGLHLGCAARNATVQFEERQFLWCSVFIELLFSSSFYVWRALAVHPIHPDVNLIAVFIRSHVTNTMVLLVLFFPKFWYHYKQHRDLQAQLTHEPSDVYKTTQDGAAGYISDIDVSEVNIADMNPDEIRVSTTRLN
uniref:Probable G-protein coupled receptor 158 n=1 Tax=Cacopsylla melanoneura TaxID=428564 RepID=A0A8D8QWF4_9HEMI